MLKDIRRAFAEFASGWVGAVRGFLALAATASLIVGLSGNQEAYDSGARLLAGGGAALLVACSFWAYYELWAKYESASRRAAKSARLPVEQRERLQALKALASQLLFGLVEFRALGSAPSAPGAATPPSRETLRALERKFREEAKMLAEHEPVLGAAYGICGHVRLVLSVQHLPYDDAESPALEQTYLNSFHGLCNTVLEAYSN